MNLLQLHEPGETPLPHDGDKAAAIGIDLGTTHSVVGYAEDGQVEILRNTHGHTLVPSVVDYVGAEPVVGYAARAAHAKGAKTTVASIKRHMHEASMKVEVAGRSLSPVEISADILRALKGQAERALGHAIDKAVITVPAYFDDAARTATRDAARLAGLTVLRLLAEPTAAALAYGLDRELEGIYAIYDLGGGTFDISLLKLEKGVFRVIATGGDTQLGGDDFDAALGKRLNISLMQAREVKEQLSEAATLANITRAEFETLIMPLVERTIAICQQAMFDAKLAANEIKGVVLVGGATRTPLVKRLVAECFGQTPLDDVNPDEVVAAGAALQAAALTHGANHLLLDVTPLSLGLETMGGLAEKVIQRNTPIPVSAAQEFTTWQDGQTGMQIHVVQGEREMAEQNRSLAGFELSGIPPLPAGIARVKVMFTVDADGLLTVSATEMMTGAVQAVEVRPTYGLEPEAMAKMLLESMEHAREDITQRLLAEAKMEAERAIIELESAMKIDGSLLAEAESRLISSQINYVREAIKEGDRDRIDVELQQLAAAANPFAQKRMDKAIASALKGSHIEGVESKLSGKTNA